jgi:hypothetical protein
MLRHFAATAPSLACMAFAGALVACGQATPVGVGSDFMQPEAPDGGVEGQAGSMGEPAVGDGMGSFLDQGWERGEVSPYCESSFDACGGVLAGTWEVEDSCNPQIRDPEILRTWGESRMDLDPAACWNAVQRLTSRWSGHIVFDGGMVADHRERAQKVEMGLTSTCLGPTLGLDELDRVTAPMCESLQDMSTSCALATGVCMCSNETTVLGRVTGVYAAIGTTVVVKNGERPLKEYEYCVDGDHLLWREEPGSLRHVVLRRIKSPPPGTTDPVEIPR